MSTSYKTRMRANYRILISVAAIIASAISPIAHAQKPQKQSQNGSAESAQKDQQESKEKENSVIICDFGPMVTINVSVIDGNNRPISDLRHKDFSILEDSVKQQTEFWFHDGSSVSFGLAFGISDYEPLRTMARRAALDVVRQSGSADNVAIPQLKTDNETVRDFTADKRRLEVALSGISPKNQLADLIAEAVKSARAKSKDCRNAVVVITDGLSLSGSASDRDQAYAVLRQGIPVYFIILDDGRRVARADMRSRFRQSKNLLTRIAGVSGGLALVVKSENEISAAAKQIINRLKSQHTMGYYPANERYDGSFRNIRVIVTPKDKRKVKVFAPSGYYALHPEKIREEYFNDRK